MRAVTRRDFLKTSLAGTALAALPARLWADPPNPGRRPNIVLVVADDLGWRDLGYQGSPYAITPNLDDLAAKGVRFDYHYAAGTVCCPNRYSILTGRTPSRAGYVHLSSQSSGQPRPPEILLQAVLKQAGYRTGHFGKSHISMAGFEKNVDSGNYFDIGASLSENGKKGAVQLPEGVDSSVALMEVATPWIDEVSKGDAPFFAYICFGAPHNPQRGAEDFKALYQGRDLGTCSLDRYAEISGLDAAVGNLRKALRKANVAENTLLWFVSDNGGHGGDASNEPSKVGKGDIGCRTAACLEWPGRVTQPLRTAVPTVHTDILPTVLAAAEIPYPDQRPIDGINLLPLLDGRMKERPQPIGFMEWRNRGGAEESTEGPVGGKGADTRKLVDIDFVAGTEGKWLDGSHLLVVNQPGWIPSKAGIPDGLYDIYADEVMKQDLSATLSEKAQAMRAALDVWRKGVRDSFEGKDPVGNAAP
jgi:arylsulfatase A-like enzyme